MSNIKKLNDLKREEKLVKFERNVYFVSCILFFITVFVNVVNIMLYPRLLNGIILEINIFMILLCGYLFLQKQKKITLLEDKKIELKIECILNRS